MNEALLLDRQGRIAEAIAAYERVLRRWPALPNCWYNLGVLQRKTRQFSAALSSYQKALDRGVAQPEEVHLNRAVIYADYLRRDEAAEKELLSALALNPAYIPALINLANLYEDLGRRESALATYEKILAFDPNCLEALARYVNFKAFSTPDDPLIAEVQRALAAPRTSAAERASLGFALGRVLDSCGDYTAAFAAYAAANRASRSSAPAAAARYDRAAEERYVDQLIAAFPSARGASAAQLARPQPIFVCGMFRSGSTLIEHVLAGHPRVSAGGELDLLPLIAAQVLAPAPAAIATAAPQHLQALAAGYLEALAELFPGAEYVTDKRPQNFLYIGLIKLLFPGAKIVHTTRAPLDNCLSIFFQHLDHHMSYAADLMDIGHHYRQYLRLMAHWKGLFAGDIFDVDYDAFVRAPRPLAGELLAFLGLEWDERCLAAPPQGRAIKTASVWQVREPLHQRSSGRAQHYVRELDELRAYLEGLRSTPTTLDRAP